MKRLLEQDLDYYSTKVKIYLYVEGVETDIDHVQEVAVEYKIDIEYRSWGIKDMTPIFDRPVKLWYSILEEKDNAGEQKEVNVDLSDAEVSYVGGGGWAPEQLDVRLSKDGKVLKKELTMRYTAPGVD